MKALKLHHGIYDMLERVNKCVNRITQLDAHHSDQLVMTEKVVNGATKIKYGKIYIIRGAQL